MKRVIIAALAATTMMSGAAYANNGNGHNNGKGWGVGHVPPGHQKKLDVRRGGYLPDGYRIVRDYSRYGLPAPGDGYRYARYDDQIYKIASDTAAVVTTLGLVANLLNN